MEDNKTLPASLLPERFCNGKVGATYLRGDNWGQLCNKMGIIAGIFHEMRVHNELNNFLAINSIFSKTAWAFDLKALSSRTPGVLMDCEECDAAASFLRCNSLIVAGKVYDVSGEAFRVSNIYNVINMYWEKRPRRRGPMPELMDTIVPKKHLQNLIRDMVDEFHADMRKMDPNMKSVGIHRRYMDSMCYKWFSSSQQYNCHPMGEAYTWGPKYSTLQASLDKEFKETDMFRKADDSLRRVIEAKAPWVLTCNYTLTDHQIELINATWPVITQSPLAVLLADDNQTPMGYETLRKSRLPKMFFNLQNEERAECFSKKKDHNMLADMLGMSMTDYHMGMVLSSCDDIVVHWRMRERKANASSYPTGCYDPYYHIGIGH